MTFGEGMYMEWRWEYIYRKLLPLLIFFGGGGIFLHLILQQAALYNIADRIIETNKSKKDTSQGPMGRLIMKLTSIFQIFTIKTVWNDTWNRTLSETLYSKNLHLYFQSDRCPQCSDTYTCIRDLHNNQ